MEKIKIGTILYEDDTTTDIYNNYPDYFQKTQDEDGFIEYKIIKEPSKELLNDVGNYYFNIRMRRMKQEKLISKIANDVYAELSNESKKYLYDHPDNSSNHFGLCMYIRNKYIYSNKYDCTMFNADCLSGDILEKLSSMIIENYDYNNPFCRVVYDDSKFTYLRRLYHSIFGIYPDDKLKKYDALPDKYFALDKVTNKIISIVVNKERFTGLCKKYNVPENRCNEFIKFADEYNQENLEVIPYDIAILCSKFLDNNTRAHWLNVLNSIIKENHSLVTDLPIFIFNQKDTVLIAVKYCGTLLENFKEFNSDDEVIKVALNNNGEAIQYVNEELRNNEEYIKLALSNTNGYALQMDCMIPYRDYDEYVRIALKVNPYNIKWVSQRLRDDYDTAVFAIKHTQENKSTDFYRYLSPRLRDNLELALLDIYEGSASVPYYLERLKDSDKVAKALIDTDNKWKICYMFDRIRKKYNID